MIFKGVRRLGLLSFVFLLNISCACNIATTANTVAPDRVLSRESLALPFASVSDAEIAASELFGFPAKTLLVRLSEPQTVLSSLHGWAEGVRVVGNHYASPPSWPITHDLGMEKSNARTLALHGLNAQTSLLLYTGADMDNLAYAEKESDGIRVGVLATAGVKDNALRASQDAGNFVEHGTINLLILTNRHLSPAAMTGAIITATEAKTAVLEDLDIRSSHSGTPATGTGTDNVLVVAGNSSPAAMPAAMTGGHTKLGELTAKAVYAAVREAINKQNHLIAQRDIFTRLAEHKINLQALTPDMTQTLKNPRYAGFMASALALSDSAERGLLPDNSAFTTLCFTIAGELSGRPVMKLNTVFTDEQIAPLVRQALNALATGLQVKVCPKPWGHGACLQMERTENHSPAKGT